MFNQNFKLIRSQFALLVFLLINSLGGWAAQNPDWAHDFYGTVRFQLTDDPEFAKQQNQLQFLEAELNRLKGVITQKQQFLQQKNQIRQDRFTALTQIQNSVNIRINQLQDSQKEIIIQNTKINTALNLINSNEQILKNKTNELTTYNNQLDPIKEKLLLAQADVELQQKNYDATLAKCQSNTAAGIDCLNDDAQVALAHQKLIKSKELEKYFTEQVAHFNQLISDVRKVIENSTAVLNSAKIDKSDAETRIVELNLAITKFNTEIPALNEKAKLLNAQLSVLSDEIASITGEINNLNNIARQQGLTYERHFVEFNKMREQLINDILSFNRQGYTNARGQGAQEGIEIASDIGTRKGQEEGRPAGLSAGENDGRIRDYQAGQAIGDNEGTRRGQEEGSANGRSDGQRDGFKEAGVGEGRVAGYARADRSDAFAVGDNEGRLAGVQHAVQDGQIEGSKQGESGAISQFESQALSNVVINGQFAGAFSNKGQTLYFPGTRHKYYNENVNVNRQILRLAYIEGYSASYDVAAEKTYYDNVQKIFNEAFDNARAEAYTLAFKKYYADSYDRGRIAQEAIAYERQYKPAFNAAYVVAKTQSLASPDRNSLVFKSAFQASELENYNIRYAEIRRQAHAVAERDTYGRNIATQTEKFRTKRFNEVSAVYVNYPVLKFVSSSVSDAGINGVAGKDGVFQPGEKVLHDVTIANFSSMPASGVKVIATNGQITVLPNLAGKSMVTIKGAILDQIPAGAAIGSSFTTVLASKFDLASNEKNIQGRYFSNASTGLINSGNQIVVPLSFPLELNLKLDQPIVVGRTSAIIAEISNKSKRSFVGPLTIELTSSMGNSIVTTNFSNVEGVDNSLVKSRASVTITDVSEIFSDVDFSAVIKQSGVVIGEVKNVARDYVKASYVSVPGAPVILIKSTTKNSRQLYKDLIAEIGGTEKVSVLDLAAGDLAQNILENAVEMKGKTFIVINDVADSLVSLLDKVFTLKNVAVVFIKDSSSIGTLTKAQTTLSNLKGATSFPLNIDGTYLNIVSSSVIANPTLGNQVSALEVGIKELNSLEHIIDVLKFTHEDLLDAIAKSVTPERFFSKDSEVKLLGKIAIMRNLEEIMGLNDGFVGSDKDDKSFVQRLKTDTNLFMNKYKNVIISGTDEARMANALLALAFYNGSMKALEDVPPMNNVENKIRRASEKSLDDMITGGFLGLGSGSAIKFLKKSGHKDFVSRAKEIQEVFYPF